VFYPCKLPDQGSKSKIEDLRSSTSCSVPASFLTRVQKSEIENVRPSTSCYVSASFLTRVQSQKSRIYAFRLHHREERACFVCKLPDQVSKSTSSSRKESVLCFGKLPDQVAECSDSSKGEIHGCYHD
jgi:hypothetical protein